MKGYTLADLPLAAQRALLRSHVLDNVSEYRAYVSFQREKRQASSAVATAGGLFSGGLELNSSEPVKPISPKVINSSLIWASNSYDGLGVNFFAAMDRSLVKHIVPRSEKAKAEQKKRTKDKAEVFTPSWVCNLQNNLIDDQVLYEGAFNRTVAGEKTWEPSAEPINFTKAKALSDEPDYSWLSYVASPRLEITCGEAPYLMSRYDTVSGDEIPVRDEASRFQRIGLLDRKFRVIAENVGSEDHETWMEAARLALLSTYGYEWQGDNLLLARLSFLNSFVDYHKDFFGKLPSKELLEEVAHIASWQLWQMDGLKMVTPLSCSESCESCKKKLRVGHDGQLPLIHWGERMVIFDEFLQS